MRSRTIRLLRPPGPAAPSFYSFPSNRGALHSRIWLPLASSIATAAKKVPPRPAPRYPQSRNGKPASPPPPPDHFAEQQPALDPQAAIPEAATVSDVDPSLAAAIPTPNSSSSSSSNAGINHAFATALSGDAHVAGGNGSGQDAHIDWSSSFHGLSTTPFSPETSAVLMAPIAAADIEIKPDGIVYLPEIKYRRILNQAFGPGGWGLAPRGELVVGEKVVTREYALIVHGRFIAQARGECQYFSEETIPTAGEGCKSNALLRCCKDLGIASELWDPRFIREFKKLHCQEIWVEHVVNKKRRQIWTRKDCDPAYPFKAVK